MEQEQVDHQHLILVDKLLTDLEDEQENQNMKKKWEDTQKDYAMHSEMLLKVTASQS